MRFSISFLIIFCLCISAAANPLKTYLTKKSESGTVVSDLKSIFSQLALLKAQPMGNMDAFESVRPLEAGKTDEAMRLVEKMIGESSSKNQISNYLNE
ncbi:MAG: hypothetical protein NT033_06500 [Candidatus Omnitrophica bacterium]|nr:hypothetical protein [Candidatus Omnitrophota bacterium]